MIGNDVVDLILAKTESNWKRRGFLEKIFTEKEITFILRSADQEKMVWLLWSRKEAVYKIINREKQIRAFNPKKIKCLSSDINFSLLRFEKQYYFAKSKIFEEKIETIAIQNLYDFKKIAIINDLKLIKKVNFIPFYNGLPASISHHGRYMQCVALI